ncbi:MAG: AbrB/MazE/SpoVT family DNA-binding domain-containing protein [Thermomicrobiales bacterium]
MALATIDAKGRVAIPAELRKRFGLEPGDAFFFDADEDADVIRMAKPVNPFDILADHAIDEYNAGRTVKLRDYAAEKGFALDDEDSV